MIAGAVEGCPGHGPAHLLGEADLCARKGFLDFSGHVRERDKALLRRVLVGGTWNGVLLSRVEGRRVPCRFCCGDDGDGHLFWDCTFPRLVEIREHPEFHDLMELDKSSWPGW